ncbi:putative ribosome-binding factor A, mitochondrial [Diachasma alloeum]|uniref:putative ribosome-binding factor A, mitochondrial n=1 Tax=Diachasma alloeum TaxID=454923 RepID=UPI0007384E38|nr:putative ribosome-binding factor A, mitochondrial [Diachasma alloeum]
MLQLNKVSLTYSYCRYFMITSSIRNKNYFARQGKFIKKLMREDAPKKKWHMTKPGRVQQSFSGDSIKVISPHVTRRLNVLNKLFMTHITDLMTTGEVSGQIVGRGIEISRVKLANDFHVVRVYWFCNDDDTDRLEETTRHLEQIAFRLRHELSQLKVIGVVPQILFVKDKAVAANLELQKRIAEADYGEDHVPIVNISPPKPQLTLYTPLPEDVRKKILEYSEEDKEEAEDDAFYAVDLPPMKHDVLGLNHWKIMFRVKMSLNKLRAVEASKKQWSPLDCQQPFNPESMKIHQNTTSEEMKAFDDFLLKRKIDEKRRDRWELRDWNNIMLENDKETDEDNESYDDFEEEHYAEMFDGTDDPQETLQ